MSKQHDLAIPDRAVEKYRAVTGVNAQAEEVREAIRVGVADGWEWREELTKKFGHTGYGISSGDVVFILNPDRMTNHEFVVMSVYTKEQFKARQEGEFFRDISFGAPIPALTNYFQSNTPVLMYRVECNGEEIQEFDREEQVLAYLSSLVNKGRSQRDWTVWKKVRTSVAEETR